MQLSLHGFLTGLEPPESLVPQVKKEPGREAVLRILPVLAAMSSGWEEYHQQMTFLPEHECQTVGHTQQSADLVPCGLSCFSIFAAFGFSLVLPVFLNAPSEKNVK